MSLAVGQSVANRYTVEAALGEGSFGHVYLARDEVMGESVALKIAREQKPLYVPMWREAAVLRRLKLPGVASLLDEGRTPEGFFYFVMELAPGRAMTTTDRRWSVVQHMIVEALWVLSRVHDYGFVHGDIKPSNVFWDQGICTVLDFGLARGDAFDADDPSDMLMGTLAYASPEQLRGESLTAASDIYGIGVMCYELLTGQLPHPASSFAQLARARLMMPPPTLPADVDVPAAVRPVLERMLAREVEARYADAGSVLSALMTIGALDAHRVDDPLRLWLESHPQPTRAQIQALFAGPDVVHHLAEDATELLMTRTQGRVSLIERELRAWLNTNLAHWQDTQIAISRDALRRLATGVRLRLDESLPPSGLNADEMDVLAWTEMLWPQGTVTLVRQLSGLVAERWDEVFDRLVALGHLELFDAQLIVSEQLGRVVESHWDDTTRQRAHAQIAQALPRGTASRILHLLMGDISAQGIELLCQEAVALDELGHGADTHPILDEALGLVRTHRMGAALERLVLITWSKQVLTVATPQTLERLLFEVECSDCRKDLVKLEALLAAARLVCLSEGKMALPQLDVIEPFDDVMLELRRHQYRVQASWSQPLEILVPLVEDVVAWASSTQMAEVLATARGWQAMVAYRELDFQRAADLHAQAARDKRRKTGQLSSMLNQANALVDAFVLESALNTSLEGQALAGSIRHAHYEARAIFISRACRHRLERAIEPDVDFVGAVARLNIVELEGIVCLHEAAIAWRCGQLDVAQELAAQGQRAWSRTGNTWGAMLNHALRFACGVRGDVSAPEVLWETILSCPLPRVACQIAGLYGHHFESDAFAFDVLLDRLTDDDPRDIRLEVLSIDESMACFESPEMLLSLSRQ